jgi:methionyl-tRNA synthetase
VLKETHHWYLPLDKYESWLRNWILEEHKEWKPNVYGQCKSWLDQDFCPQEPLSPTSMGYSCPLKVAEGQVLYVWLRCTHRYISATKELTPEWEKYWKDLKHDW